MTEGREIARLVPVPRLLEALGFAFKERTHRCACVLHRGSNPTAFSWREDGLWYCHSCRAGGDKIALIRAVRQCGFREAVRFLAALAGVEYQFQRASQHEIEKSKLRRARAELAAWRIADEIGRLRRYYMDGLHRTERLQRRIGNKLLRSGTEAERDAEWERLARLAPVCTFFFAAWSFTWDAKANALAHFALASPGDRRRFILEGKSDGLAKAA
jgi:hypothetical protein